MKSRQAGRHRWREALLGGWVGLGVPVVLRGRARGRRGSNPAIAGVVAGLLGALVGGRLARRARGEPEQVETVGSSHEKARAAAPEPRRGAAPEPRRGPNGRERFWLPAEALTPTS